MAQALSLLLVDPTEQSFIPKAFGGGTQIVLNTTSTDDILSQLSDATLKVTAQRENQATTPLELMSTGCYVNGTEEAQSAEGGVRAGDGYRDCAQACSDPGMMFNSSYTFWNCLTLGAASLYAETGDLVLDASSVSVAGVHLGFASLADFNGTQILTDAVSCIKASCQDYSLGSCSRNTTALDILEAQDMVAALWNGVSDYCDGMDSVVNSDIAGPGVRSFFACLMERERERDTDCESM